MYGAPLDDGPHRKFNPNNVVNYDESMGYTVHFDPEFYAEKGSTRCSATDEKKIPRDWDVRQGYFIVFGCTMAGRMLPPLIGIRDSARSAKTRLQEGKPIVIDIDNPEYTSLFDSEGISPKVIIYAHGDKKVSVHACLSRIYENVIIITMSMIDPPAPSPHIYRCAANCITS